MSKHPTAKRVSGIAAVSAVAVIALASACATSKRTSKPIHAEVAPRSGSPLSSACPPGSSSSAATSAAGTAGAHSPTDTVDQSLVERGYERAQYKGVVVYCQSILTPEHFRETRCYTADQIKAMDRDAQLLKNHLMTPGTCAGWGLSLSVAGASASVVMAFPMLAWTDRRTSVERAPAAGDGGVLKPHPR